MTEEGAGELSEEQLEVLRVLATGGLADSWGSATVSNRSGKNATNVSRLLPLFVRRPSHVSR
jgi:hypothetical protein